MFLITFPKPLPKSSRDKARNMWEWPLWWAGILRSKGSPSDLLPSKSCQPHMLSKTPSVAFHQWLKVQCTLSHCGTSYRFARFQWNIPSIPLYPHWVEPPSVAKFHVKDHLWKVTDRNIVSLSAQSRLKYILNNRGYASPEFCAGTFEHILLAPN